VLLYAFRLDAREHKEFHRWLVERLGAAESYGVSELVLSSVIRIATHPRVFVQPSTVEEALAFAAAVRDRPNAVLVAPGPRHWRNAGSATR
jgi:predicted nucleic acid-binding protein